MRTTPYKIRGMTLIELMTVIVVVAVLGGIAVSSYRNYMVRANRTEAKQALLRVQVAQEKFFLQRNRYADGATELAAGPPDGLGVPATTPGGNYTLTLDGDDTSYTVTATAAGGQSEDTGCTALTINELGQRTPSPDTNGCWR